MTNDEIKQYRSSIETQLKEKETDIETTTTYITLGLLGLFITINEKFIPLATSKHNYLLFISILSFVVSFIIGIFNKIKTTKFDREIIDLIDSIDLTIEDNEVILLEKWQTCDNSLQKIRKFIYCFLVLGVVFQLFYFYTNLSQNTPKESEVLKIEILLPKADTTIRLEKAQIHIHNTNDTSN